MSDIGTAAMQKLKPDPIWHALQQIQKPALPTLGAGQAWLICRMGDGMYWSTFADLRSVDAEVDGVKRRLLAVFGFFESLYFARSKAAVKPDWSNLAGGSAGWLDRPMADDEPRKVLAPIDQAVLHHTVIYGNGSTIGGGMNFAGPSNTLSFQPKSVFAVAVHRPPQATSDFVQVAGTSSLLLSGAT